MAFKCPHCTQEIAGAMSQESHLERLNAKTAENTELKAKLTEAQGAASEVTTLRTERDQLKSELTKRDRQAEESAAFEEAGVASDTKIRQGFTLVYNSEMSGAEAPVPFKDWLSAEGTKAHPLLSSGYARQQTTGLTNQGQANGQQVQGNGQGTQANGQQQGQQNGANGTHANGANGTNGQQRTSGVRPQGGLTNVDRGATPPSDTDTGPKTAAELQAYLRSDEYRALPLAEQKKRVGELRSKLQPGRR